MHRQRIIILFILCLMSQAFLLNAQDTVTDQREILINLVKGFQKSRDSVLVKDSPAKDLVNLDLQIFESLKSQNLQPAEDIISEFVREIIVYNITRDTASCVAGFDLLEYNFQNKKYYVDTAIYCMYLYAEENPYVVERIFQGYARMVKEHHTVVLDRLRVALKGAETVYIRNRRQYGRGPVISSLALFFNTYMKLVDDGFIIEDMENNKEDYERRQAILNICKLLDLNRSKGINDIYPNVKELKYAFVFYSNM